jgi:hypothetical protein
VAKEAVPSCHSCPESDKCCGENELPIQGISEKLTSVYLRVLCGEIFMKKFTTEDTGYTEVY